MTRLVVFTDPKMADHVPGPGFPERPARWRAAADAIEGHPLVDVRRPQPITRDALVAVHDATYVDAVLGAEGRPFAVDPETLGSEGSVTAARLAAGAACDAALTAISGTPAFALVRPPGHHATHRTGMGFCLFNNVVLAARAARAEPGIARVLIVDWDVHHGNGTEDLVRGDASVLFFSTHQGGDGFYPGTGLDSVDNALNVPLTSGQGDAALLAAFRDVLRPAAERFDPDLVLVSAGFDAHADDPLAGLTATADGFGALCHEIRDLAQTHAEGRVALVLEGGYDLDALEHCVRACVEVLTS